MAGTATAFSVIVPTQDSERTLSRSLGPIGEQSYPEIEVIVELRIAYSPLPVRPHELRADELVLDASVT